MLYRGFAFVLLTVTMAVLCAAGTLVGSRTISDDFNDNSIDSSLWRVDSIGDFTLRERHRRLEMRADGNTGHASGAVRELKKHGVNWKRNFVSQIDYNLDSPAPCGARFAALLHALAFESYNPVITGVAANILRTSDGYWLAWFLVVDAQIVDFQRKRINGPTGTLSIKWRQSPDKMIIKAAGEKLRLRNLYRELGDEYGDTPMILGIGGGTGGGDMEFSGSDVYIDNFEFTGNTKRR